VTSSGTTIHYKVLYNPTLTGASWQNTDSYVQVDLSASAFSGGYPIDTGFLTTTARSSFQTIPPSFISFQSDINGTPDILTVVARSTSGTNRDILVSLIWREVF
jgi:hypothetical protein